MERIWAIIAFQSDHLDIFPAQHQETNTCTSSLVLIRLSKGHINVTDLRNWKKTICSAIFTFGEVFALALSIDLLSC